MSAEKARNYTSSSNLLYQQALWAAAKRSSGILGFRKYVIHIIPHPRLLIHREQALLTLIRYFFWKKNQSTKILGQQKGLSFAKSNKTRGKNAALVDIVAAEGTEWVRVSTVSEKRLLFELAKLGWQNDSDSDDGDVVEAPEENWEEDDDEDQVDIVKSARDLARAARANPIRGHLPKVRFVLTRIESGKLKEVDMILGKMRATGIKIQCANDLPPTPSLSSVLPNLLIKTPRSLSSTLNLDCTVLLALISDISHTQCPILDWYPSEVRAQIEDEEKEKLLPTHLYPAISDHPMVCNSVVESNFQIETCTSFANFTPKVCTEEAAAQMNLIVDTLATDREKTRANILLAQRTHTSLSASPEALLSEWQSLSDHPLPPNTHFPVRVVPSNLSAAIPKLPAVAKTIAAELTPLNSAIFFYGWVEGVTTLSSNRTRAKQIEHAINKYGLEDGEAGPHIWLCGDSRSLIAKHGRRR
jgi:hypothetical protein